MGENEEKTLKKKRQVLAFDDARPLNHGTKKNESQNDEKAPVFQLPEWPVVLRGVRSLKCRHDTHFTGRPVANETAELIISRLV